MSGLSQTQAPGDTWAHKAQPALVGEPSLIQHQDKGTWTVLYLSYSILNKIKTLVVMDVSTSGDTLNCAPLTSSRYN